MGLLDWLKGRSTNGEQEPGATTLEVSEDPAEQAVIAAAKRDASRDAALLQAAGLPASDTLVNAIMERSMTTFFCEMVSRDHPELEPEAVRAFVSRLIAEREVDA
jgi:hypothetical protein